MNVKFKNSEATYECTEPTEQKVYRAGVATGWILVFGVRENLTSADVDVLLADDGISEMVFTSGENSYILSGYDKVSSCVVRYREDSTSVELQFTKGV